MRSIFISFAGIKKVELINHLKDFFISFTESNNYDFFMEYEENIWCWLYLRDSIPDTEMDDIEAVEKKLGSKPSVVLIIDVSGKGEYRELLIDTLKNFQKIGTFVIQDDYSAYAWSFSELHKTNEEGRFFFKSNH